METFIPLAQPDLSGNERAYVDEALRDGWISNSAKKFHGVFEIMLANFFKRPTIATNCGTGAIQLALMCSGVEPGDEVILPALTFGSAASAVKLMGAKIVLADVDESACLDPFQVDRVMNRRIKAIMPTHLYGMRAYVDYDIPTIEDACEAFGLIMPSADYACFSFFANKPITTGEGGAFVAKAEDVAHAKLLRDGGFDVDYCMNEPGLNYCMTNLQAALGVAQMERVRELLSARARNAAIYAEALPGFGHWLYVAELNDPVMARMELLRLGIETRRVFCPLHLTPAFRTMQSFPNAERIWKRGLCLPTGPHVTPEKLEYIIDCVKSVTTGARAPKPLGATPQHISA